jgi:hypothetical protein
MNYRDGDKQSTRYYNFGSSEDDDTEKQKDENHVHSPKHNVTTDSLVKWFVNNKSSKEQL